MLTKKFLKKAQRFLRQTGGHEFSAPRDSLPQSYYVQQSFDKARKKSLEEKAKELLKWKITGKGKIQDPFKDVEQRYELIQYMLKKDYVAKAGQTPKSLTYTVTPKGRKWAFGK